MFILLRIKHHLISFASIIPSISNIFKKSLLTTLQLFYVQLCNFLSTKFHVRPRTNTVLILFLESRPNSQIFDTKFKLYYYYIVLSFDHLYRVHTLTSFTSHQFHHFFFNPNNFWCSLVTCIFYE